MKIGMDLLGMREQRDLTTGLKTITSFGGPYPLAQLVRSAARGCGFRFRKESF